MFECKIGRQKFLFAVILLSIFLRVHPVFVPDVIAVYFFDGIIAMAVIGYGKLNLSKDMVYFMAAVFAVLVLKVLFFKFDADSFLSVFKLWFYFAVYSCLKKQMKEEYGKTFMKKMIGICFWSIFVIAIIQFLEIPYLSRIVYALYGEHKLRSLWTGYPRVYSSFYNANWFAVFIASISVYYTSEYFRRKEWAKYLLRIMACVAMLVISGSRTGIIALVIGAGLCLVFNGKILPVIVSSAGFGAAGIIMLYYAGKSAFFEQTYQRFLYFWDILTKLRSGNQVELMADSRWEFWLESWNYLQTSPVIGNAMGNRIPHNAYISFLISFGFLGVILLIPFILKEFFKMTDQKQDKITRAYNAASFCMLGVIMMSGDYLFATQLMLSQIVLFSAVNGQPQKDEFK